MKCLVDMDGVVADFTRSACEHHRLPWPYAEVANRGEHAWDLLQYTELSFEEFWAPFGYEFWLGLSPTPEAFTVMGLLEKCFGPENICFLTSPCETPGCVDGKWGWIRRHFPEYARRVMFGQQKEFCANERHLLVDDHQRNVERFRDAGGQGFLVPRPWNAMHDRESYLLDELEEYLQKFNAREPKRLHGRSVC